MNHAKTEFLEYTRYINPWYKYFEILAVADLRRKNG